MNQDFQLCEECQELEKTFDMRSFFQRLSEIRCGKTPDSKYQKHLCLLVSGLNPIDITRREMQNYFKQGIIEKNPGISVQELQNKLQKNISNYNNNNTRPFINREIKPDILILIELEEPEFFSSLYGEEKKERINWQALTRFLTEKYFNPHLRIEFSIDQEKLDKTKIRSIIQYIKKNSGLNNIELIQMVIEGLDQKNDEGVN